MKKILISILASFLMIGCGIETSSDEEVNETVREKEAVTILYTNDTHSYVNNLKKDDEGNMVPQLTFASVAAMKNDLIAEGNKVLLLDGGDHSSGNVYGSMDKGKRVIEIMNAAGYDAATVGNHEFDYGRDRLFEMAEEAKFTYVSSSFYNTTTNELVFEPYKIFDLDGTKVAVIGISTPETYTSSSPVYFQDDAGNILYSFYSGTDGQELYDAVQKAIDEVKDEADYIVGLAHLGIDGTSVPYRSIDVIEHTAGLDVMIDGHSHSTIEHEVYKDLDGNDVVLTQTGSYLGAVGKLVLDGDTVTTELITEYENRDDDVQLLTDYLVEDIDSQLGQIFAISDNDFYYTDPDSGYRLVRYSETNFGDLITDSYYYHFNMVENLPCDVTIANGGGIRAEGPAGDWTYNIVKSAQPFGNVICLMEVSGQTLLDALEMGMMHVGETYEGHVYEFGGFTQISGVRFEVDTSIESTIQLDANGIWAGSPTGEYRVKNLQIYNRETDAYEDIDLNKQYSIAGINYVLRNQGDGMAMFNDAKLLKDFVGEEWDITCEYIKAFDTDEVDGFPHISTDNSPLKEYSNFLLNYENKEGSGRIIIK